MLNVLYAAPMSWKGAPTLISSFRWLTARQMASATCSGVCVRAELWIRQSRTRHKQHGMHSAAHHRKRRACFHGALLAFSTELTPTQSVPHRGTWVFQKLALARPTTRL